MRCGRLPFALPPTHYRMIGNRMGGRMIKTTTICRTRAFLASRSRPPSASSPTPPLPKMRPDSASIDRARLCRNYPSSKYARQEKTKIQQKTIIIIVTNAYKNKIYTLLLRSKAKQRASKHCFAVKKIGRQKKVLSSQRVV